MNTEKLSVSLPGYLVRFVEDYKTAHARKSRSQVIEEALKLLRDHELEQAYKDAAQEVDPAFDVTASDGLADEAW